jgi:hypothetical protein
MSQRGSVFTLCDGDITLASGPLDVVDTYLIARVQNRTPGPPRTTCAPAAWAAMVDQYLLTLAAAGQRPLTMRLRSFQLCQMARGLDCPPKQVTGEMLVNWFGRQQHWTPEGRKSYRAGVRGFFDWAQRFGRLPTNPGDFLPKVRVPKAPPRPASDKAWEAALIEVFGVLDFAGLEVEALRFRRSCRGPRSGRSFTADTRPVGGSRDRAGGFALSFLARVHTERPVLRAVEQSGPFPRIFVRQAAPGWCTECGPVVDLVEHGADESVDSQPVDLL